MTVRPSRRFVPWSDSLEARLALSIAPVPVPTDYEAYEAELSAEADKEFDPSKVPAGVDPDHDKDLSYDPAIKAYRYDEADSALRVEKQLGVQLKRYTPDPTNPSDKGDFIDKAGKKYDGCSPAPTAKFDQFWDSYKDSLTVKHLGNPNIDKVIVDTTGLNLTADQLKALDDFIGSLPQADRDRIK